MKAIRWFPSLLVFMVIIAADSSSQIQTGFPQFGSFKSFGPATVDLGNLNVHVSIPLYSKPGRGIPFSYVLNYDSSVWVAPYWALGPNTAVGSGQLWVREAGFGWVEYFSGTKTCVIGLRPPFHFTHPSVTEYGPYHDASGAIHNFNQVIGGCTGDATSGTQTTDGYTMTASSSGVTITSPAGGVIIPVLNGNSSGAAHLTDVNGNQISTDGSNYIDSLGMTPITVTGANPATMTYTDTTGTQRSVTLNYTQYTLQTAFGCSGTNEGSGTEALLTGVVYADGSSYQIAYESTPGHTPGDGVVTGRISSLGLPTGATITFAYTGANDGIVCADGTTAALTVTTTDGVWQYQRSPLGVNNMWQTTVTDPQSNQTVMNFGGVIPTQVQEYQGPATGSPVRTQTICFNGSSVNCPLLPPPSGFSQRTTTLQLNSGQQKKLAEFYNANGLLSETDEYDFGSGAPGALKRRTIITYATLGNNILNRPAGVTVCSPGGSDADCGGNGSGTKVAKTTYVYDDTSLVLSGASGLASISGSRGNLTHQNVWLNANNTFLTTTYSYFDTGQLQSVTDPNGNTTSASYGCNGAYATQITLPNTGSAHVLSATYDCNSGLPLSSTDQNNQITTMSYDLMLRPFQISFPDGGQTTITYPSTVQTVFQRKIDSSNSTYASILRDGYGRTSRIAVANGESQPYDQQDTCYDSKGQLSFRSYPYQGSGFSAPKICSGAGDTIAYDALGRITQVTKSDGSFVTGDYSQFPVVTVTDEAGKVHKTKRDGLGHLIGVWEDPNGLNYETDYQYDVLGNRLRVDQKGSAPSDSTQWRTRTFTYDSVSRTLCVSQAEIGGPVTCPTPDNGTYTTGTIRYSYDSNGNMLTRTAPAPNQTGSATVTTTYTYDALNRLIQKSYSDGTTKSAYFSFDVPPSWGVPVSNIVGRLAWFHSDLTSPRGASIFSYDSVGRIIMNDQCTPANCGTGLFATSYTYDLAGNMTSHQDGTSPVFTQSFDSAGRVTQLSSNMVDAQHPGTLATVDSSVGYYATGDMRKVTFGNGLTETGALNNRLQPCRTNVNSSASVLTLCNDAVPGGNIQDFTYGYNLGTADNGNVTSISATGSQTFNRSYSYDSLNRLQAMSAPGDPCSGLSWTYDPWANRTDQTVTGGSCNSFHQPVATNNRLSGAGYQYDAAGNMTNDGSHTYTYDAENRIVAVDGGNTASYIYDALGRRVRKTTGSTWTDYVYDLAGSVVTEYQNTCAPICWATSYIHLSGHLVAEYKDGTTYFVHKDHLGSTRLLTAAGAATRIQSSGGTSTWKYYYTGVCPSVSGVTYTVSVWVKNQGATSMKISGNIVDGPVIAPGTTQQVNFTETGNGVSCIQLGFVTLNPGDAMDVLAFAPALTASGANLIPSANQDFSGWSTYQGSSVTITQGLAPMIVDSMDYLPYGEQIAGGTATTHKFTGDERDAETFLDHTWFRQYSSGQGRWTTPDPYSGSMDVTNPQSLNRYSYVMNPMNSTDPWGLVTIPQGWFISMLSSMNFFGSGECTADGIDTPCGLVRRWVNNGTAAICPHGDCNLVRTDPKSGHWQIFIETPGGLSDIPKNPDPDFLVRQIHNGRWLDVPDDPFGGGGGGAFPSGPSGPPFGGGGGGAHNDPPPPTPPRYDPCNDPHLNQVFNEGKQEMDAGKGIAAAGVLASRVPYLAPAGGPLAVIGAAMTFDGWTDTLAVRAVEWGNGCKARPY